MPRLPASGTASLLAACEAEGMEGVVLKRLASRYRPGVRTSDWRKVKCPGWAAYAEQRRPQ